MKRIVKNWLLEQQKNHPDHHKGVIDSLMRNLDSLKLPDIDDYQFQIDSMESDQKLIKVIEKALWSIEANGIVRISQFEWLVKEYSS